MIKKKLFAVNKKNMTPFCTIIVLALGLECQPDPSMVCTKEYQPVCADGTEYSNLCQAQAAGFVGSCATKIVAGSCSGTRGELPTIPMGLDCDANEFFSELGMCVPKPWSDFRSCAEEKRQGACPGGRDPNPWVGEHCTITCST